MRYRVSMTFGEALRAVTRRKPVPVDASRIRAETVPPGFRLCCRTRPGDGHLSDCLAVPGSALRAEITRQEKHRAR